MFLDNLDAQTALIPTKLSFIFAGVHPDRLVVHPSSDMKSKDVAFTLVDGRRLQEELFVSQTLKMIQSMKEKLTNTELLLSIV